MSVLAAAGPAASPCAAPSQLLAVAAVVSGQSPVQRPTTQPLCQVLGCSPVADDLHGSYVLLQGPGLLDLFACRLKVFERVHSNHVLLLEVLS